MDFWLNKNRCTGCGACSNICPKNAITMTTDKYGFKYPHIDNKKCINCNLCKNTCPIVKNKNYNKNTIQQVFAGWSKDQETRFSSTSGGLFTELTKPIVTRGGYVVGAGYNENNLVEHKIATNLKELNELKQSKYVQSNTNDIYRKVKKLLDNDKEVAFCGSPCQVAALYNFLKKKYNKLLTIEFICRGVNSPKAYKCWIDEIEQEENKKIKKIWFKYKENGWKTSPKRTRIDFIDNTYKILEGDKNTYMSGYLNSNLYIRPSCSNCQFKGTDRQADITLADFWGINKELDDDKGTSLILINNENGMKYFNNIKERIFYQKRNTDEISKNNICFNNSVKINKRSQKFLKEVNTNNFSYLINKYGKESFVKKIIIKIKKYILQILVQK